MRLDARRRGVDRGSASVHPSARCIGVLSNRIVVRTTIFNFEDAEGAKLFVRICARSGEEFAILRDQDNVWLLNPNMDAHLQVHIETIAAECGGSVMLVV